MQRPLLLCAPIRTLATLLVLLPCHHGCTITAAATTAFWHYCCLLLLLLQLLSLRAHLQ